MKKKKSQRNSFSAWMEQYSKDILLVLASYVAGPRESDICSIETTRLLREEMTRFLLKEPQVWLPQITVVELKLMKDVVLGKKVHSFSYSFNPLLVQMRLIAQNRTIEFDPYFQLHPELRDAVAPYLDAVINSKVEQRIDLFEQSLIGLLNLRGTLRLGDIRRMMKELLPPYDNKITEAQIDSFLNGTKLARYLTVDTDVNEDTLFLSPMWFKKDQVAPVMVPTLPTPELQDALSHGKFPYFDPFRPEEIAFCDFINRHRLYEAINSSEILTSAISCLNESDLKDLDYTMATQAISTLPFLDFDPIDSTYSQEFTQLLVSLVNNMPVLSLGGQTLLQAKNPSYSPLTSVRLWNAIHDIIDDDAEEEEWENEDEMEEDYEDEYDDDMEYDTDDFEDAEIVEDDYAPATPYRAPAKIGRNDPCPCGSGKKYKHCCGRN